MLAHLATITLARGYTRLEWAALDWNTPALDFYDKLGAARLDDWKIHRLDGDALARVAGRARIDRLMSEPAAETVPLRTIALQWTRIGVTGFGGPPTHIALLRRLVVEERRWVDQREFEDALAACNLLPGPASTQLAIFLPAGSAARAARWSAASASSCRR